MANSSTGHMRGGGEETPAGEEAPAKDYPERQGGLYTRVPTTHSTAVVMRGGMDLTGGLIW